MKSKQFGQAMVEFIVAAMFVLLPMYFGVIYLGKVADARQKAVEASRYATWERTTWARSAGEYNVKTDEDIVREIDYRIYGNQDSAIHSVNDKKPHTLTSLTLDANLKHWSSKDMLQASDNRKEFSLLTASNSRVPTSQISSTLENGISTILGLDNKGFIDSKIQLEIFKDPRYKDEWNAMVGNNKPLVTTTNNAMLVGSWNANRPAGVERVVRRALPTSFLDNGVMNTLLDVASVGFREIGDLDFGYVDPELIPCQRGTVGARTKKCR